MSDGTKPIIFIIDDDQRILRSLDIVLRNQYEVHLFSDPDVAIKAVHANVCLIILDVKMPIKDGFTVFREIRKTNLAVPIIFNSAYQDLQEESLVQYHHGPHYVHKGGDHKAFKQLIAEKTAAHLERLKKEK